MKKLEKAEQIKARRRKEIMKIRAETSKILSRKTVEKISATKSLFFENVRKVDERLVRQNKKKKIEMTNIKNERGDITIDPCIY